MSFVKLRTSRRTFVCWQFIACFAPFLWAACQAYSWSDRSIIVAAEVPLRTEMGTETIANFRTLAQTAPYGIHIVSDRADGIPTPAYPKTELPLHYAVRCGGAVVSLRNNPVWVGFGDDPKKGVTVYRSVKFLAGPSVNCTVRVRPAKPLTEYALIRPRLRICSFDRFYQYGCPV